MSSLSRQGSPLVLSVSPKLDTAARNGWSAWEASAREAGSATVAGWLAHRIEDPGFAIHARAMIEALLTETDPDALVDVRLELAEFLDEADDELAETLWDGVLEAATMAAHGDALAEASGRLAAIAEEEGDLLGAAERYIDFLNWRRQLDHASDPDAVENAFEEIMRLATADGDARAAALFSYRRASFTRVLDAADDRALAGDWERDAAPFTSWA